MQATPDSPSALVPVFVEAPPPVPFDDGLERAAPSSVGIDAGEVMAMLDGIEQAGLEVHSFMLHRRGKVVAEGWRWPYRADRMRIMHSATKSFAACAVGLAIEEGRLRLDDKVLSFFPDHRPAVVSDRLAAMTVEHLLTMRTGHESETSGSVWRQIQTSWIDEFFRIPLVHEPGTVFVYTSAASYMLTAILTRLLGTSVHEYLKPRLLEPLGIAGETWDIGPDGVNPGGNGLTMRTADLLKLGILHEQKGVWKGRRLLPEWWVEAATRPHGGPDSDYGYHWRIRPKDAFAAIGLFIQAVIVHPKLGTSISFTGAMDASSVVTPTLMARVHHIAHDAALPGPTPADAALAARLAGWQQPRPLVGAAASPRAAQVGGTVYRMEPNAAGVQTLRFEFLPDRCVLHLAYAEGSYSLASGLGGWIESPTSMPGSDLHHGYRLLDAPVAATAGWTDAQTLALEWIFTETAFRDTVTCIFEGDRLVFRRKVNVNSGALEHPELVGRAVA